MWMKEIHLRESRMERVLSILKSKRHFSSSLSLSLFFAFNRYSGSGGRDLRGNETKKKNLRTAPQSFDQNFDHPLNSALKKSSETKLPIRCIRGFKGKSIFAPPVGYIYSGLYWVESAYMERGTTGFMVS